MFEGVSLADFAKLPTNKPLRQQAKALNFGISGGLGASSLVTYAAATYGVTLLIEHASSFRDRLIGEVYPELTGSIPIACEFALSDRWYKAAEAVFDVEGKLQRWKPESIN